MEHIRAKLLDLLNAMNDKHQITEHEEAVDNTETHQWIGFQFRLVGEPDITYEVTATRCLADEPDAEELQEIEAARADVAAGRTVTMDELRARLELPKE
jgi:hypothetical protein